VVAADRSFGARLPLRCMPAWLEVTPPSVKAASAVGWMCEMCTTLCGRPDSRFQASHGGRWSVTYTTITKGHRLAVQLIIALNLMVLTDERPTAPKILCGVVLH